MENTTGFIGPSKGFTKEEFSYEKCFSRTVEFFEEFRTELKLGSKNKKFTVLGWQKDENGDLVFPKSLKNPSYTRSREDHRKMMKYLKQLVIRTHQLALVALEYGNLEYIQQAMEFKRQYFLFPIVEGKYRKENTEIDLVFKILHTDFNARWVEDRKYLTEELKQNKNYWNAVLKMNLLAPLETKLSNHLKILESTDVFMRMGSYELVKALKAVPIPPRSPRRILFQDGIESIPEGETTDLLLPPPTPRFKMSAELSKEIIKRSHSHPPTHISSLKPLKRVGSDPVKIRRKESNSSDLTSQSNESTDITYWTDDEDEGLFFLEDDDKEASQYSFQPPLICQRFIKRSLKEYVSELNNEKFSQGTVKKKELSEKQIHEMTEKAEFYLMKLEEKAVLDQLEDCFSKEVNFPLSNEKIIKWLGKKT